MQVVSCLYRNGVEYVGTLLTQLAQWMEEKGFDSIDQFRGRLAVKANEDSSLFFRTQFMRYFSKI